MVIQSVSTYETSSNSPSFTFAPAIPIVGYTIIKHQNQMQVLEEIKVSVYENVYSKKPKIMSFLEVIFMCIHPVYASIIQSIRRYHQEGDHEAAQKLKSQLPCFTPAGTFDGAHAIRNFQLPSHIIGLDYDHVPNHPSLRCRPSYRSCSGKPYGRRENLRLCGRHRRPSPGRAVTGQPLLRPADRAHQRSRL